MHGSMSSGSGGCTSTLSSSNDGGAVAVSQSLPASTAAMAVQAGVPNLPSSTATDISNNATATSNASHLVTAAVQQQQQQQLGPIAGRCRLQVAGSSLNGNRCSGRGGALYLSSCMLRTAPAADGSSNSSVFAGNAAGQGGAIAAVDAAIVTAAAAAAAVPARKEAAAAAVVAYSSSTGIAAAATAILVDLSGTTFLGNAAASSGGGLYVASAEQHTSHLLIAAGCAFTANTAGEAGGAVAIEAPPPAAAQPPTAATAAATAPLPTAAPPPPFNSAQIPASVRSRRRQLPETSSTSTAGTAVHVRLVVLQEVAMQQNRAGGTESAASGGATLQAVAGSGPRGGALSAYGGVAVEVCAQQP